VRIATWNVNSIRARTELVVDWVRRAEPDILCMQETKVLDDDFPTDELQRLGYAVAVAGQKSYNGVAIATRLALRDVQIGLQDDLPDADRRSIAATIGDLRVMSVYVPNGKSVRSPAFATKIAFFHRLRKTIDEREKRAENLILCGDFNVAPDDRDVFDPVRLRGHLHFHPDEQRALAALMKDRLIDAFRLHHAEGGHYTWWDYRGGGVRLNEGLRIDHVLVTPSVARRCRSATIDVEERTREKPSDHTPVIVEID
jgi:exodeoxyribonuclease-3